jgi:hypothetical protein
MCGLKKFLVINLQTKHFTDAAAAVCNNNEKISIEWTHFLGKDTQKMFWKLRQKILSCCKM